MAEIEAAVDWNFDGKRKPIDLNMEMVRRSYDWAQANLVKTDPYRVERMTGFNEDKILIDGNTAAALGAHLGRRDGGRLVSDHAGLQRGGRAEQIPAQAAHRPRNRQGDLRGDPGRG